MRSNFVLPLFLLGTSACATSAEGSKEHFRANTNSSFGFPAATIDEKPGKVATRIEDDEGEARNLNSQMNEMIRDIPSLTKSSETNQLSSRVQSLSVKNDKFKKKGHTFRQSKPNVLMGELHLDPKTTAHIKRLIERGAISPNHPFLKWLEHQDIHSNSRTTPDEALTILNLRVDSLQSSARFQKWLENLVSYRVLNAKSFSDEQALSLLASRRSGGISADMVSAFDSYKGIKSVSSVAKRMETEAFRLWMQESYSPQKLESALISHPGHLEENPASERYVGLLKRYTTFYAEKKDAVLLKEVNALIEKNDLSAAIKLVSAT